MDKAIQESITETKSIKKRARKTTRYALVVNGIAAEVA
jgi:hypothetical protein